jgi:hypothetical protein
MMPDFSLITPHLFFAKTGRKIGCKKGGFWHFYLLGIGKIRTFAS